MAGRSHRGAGPRGRAKPPPAKDPCRQRRCGRRIAASTTAATSTPLPRAGNLRALGGGTEQGGAQAARTFRVKPLLVISVLAAAAAVVAMVAHVLELTLPDSPVNGAWKLNDFGTNLTVAGALTAVTMVLGAIAWCAGFRWGAARRWAGAALAGWVALPSGRPSWSSAEPSRHRWADRR